MDNSVTFTIPLTVQVPVTADSINISVSVGQPTMERTCERCGVFRADYGYTCGNCIENQRRAQQERQQAVARWMDQQNYEDFLVAQDKPQRKELKFNWKKEGF